MRLRLAVMRTLKPPLLTSRTIQPTQVAGFNQFFVDPDGSEAWLYGVGVDKQISEDLSVGTEAVLRNVDENLVPTLGSGPKTVHESREEQTYRGYLYWSPLIEWAVSVEFIYDNYDSETGQFNVPTKVETWSTPVSIRYFHPSGVFGVLGGSYVFQEVNREGDAQGGDFNFEGDSNFFVMDAAVGYRLPKRRGIVSVQGFNLLNQEFKYQGNNFREFTRDPVVSRFAPQRTVTGRVTVNF